MRWATRKRLPKPFWIRKRIICWPSRALEAAFAKHFPLSHVAQYPGDYFNTIEKAHGREETRFHIRRDKAAENFAGIRPIAFNVLNSHKTFKADMKRKHKKAAMNTDYLSELLMAKSFS